MLRNRLATLSSLVTSAGIAVTPSFAAAAFRRSALREAMMTSAPSALGEFGGRKTDAGGASDHHDFLAL